MHDYIILLRINFQPCERSIQIGKGTQKISIAQYGGCILEGLSRLENFRWKGSRSV